MMKHRYFMDKLMTIGEVAETLGVTQVTLRNWDKSGKLKAVRTVGRHRRYKISDIQRFIDGKSSGNIRHKEQDKS